MKISLIMPVYNEQEILEEIIQKYKADLNQTVKGLGAGATYEFVAINDGCTDASVEILNKEAKLNTNFKIINLDQRYGKEAAITAGFEMAQGDIVIVVDVDLLNPLGVIERAVDEYQDGANVIYGYRERIGWEGFKDRLNRSLVKFGTKLFQIEGDYVGKPNIMAYSRPVADILREFPERNKLMRMMDSWTGFDMAVITYASNYSKDEVRHKVRQARIKDRRQGKPQVHRSTVRENTSSKIYSVAAIILAAMIMTFWIAFTIWQDGIHVLLHIVILLTFVVTILSSLLFLIRAIMIKRIGTVHHTEDGIIYVVKGVVNG